MSFVADLHLHSPYSYATSSSLSMEGLARWAKLKGIDLLSTSDFTQPDWFRGLKDNLVETSFGAHRFQGVDFVLGTEVSCVYRQGGRGRRIHLLIYVPNFGAAEQLTARLARYGNMQSDGRPTLALSARDVVALVLEVDAQSLVVPAHAWTPWYGLFGSKSGFDSLEEAFGDMLPHISAIETGLSSDPAMNRSVPGLKELAVVSFSDAHSLPKLGREATVFSGEPNFEGLSQGIQGKRVEFTVEMYPEEGKYHYDGHRKCGVSFRPEQSISQGDLCPECGRPLTLGVLHRVLELGGGHGNEAGKVGGPPFVSIVPLQDLIASVRGKGANTKGVTTEYFGLVKALGSELRALLWADETELLAAAGEEMTLAILKARQGDITIEPGYDGVYGRVSVLGDKVSGSRQKPVRLA